MITRLLVLTPSAILGKLIRQTLSEDGRFEVFRCATVASATEFLGADNACEFAILDTDLGEEQTLKAARDLRDIQCDLKIILIAKSETAPRFEKILPWRLLRKPFVFQDLWSVLERVWPTVIDGKATAIAKKETPIWLQDAGVAGQILNELTIGSDIQQAVIFRNLTIWASAGCFERAAIEQINYLISSNMDFRSKGDLLRYALLDANRQQHNIYATFLLLNTILTLVFAHGTPISRMRIHASVMADTLTSPLLISGQVTAPHLLSSMSSHSPVLFDQKKIGKPVPPLILPDSRRPDIQAQLISTVINPDEDKSTFTINRPFALELNSRPENGQNRTNIGSSAHPTGRDDTNRLDSRIWEDNFVACSCLLTTRFDAHTLEGRLAEFLYGKFPNICVAYGWRLRSFEVGRDYIHWVVELPPTVSPVDHITTVRRATSTYIGEEHAAYMQDNLLGDFWAPGFSVMGGAGRFTMDQIKTFVQKNKDFLTARHGVADVSHYGPKRILQ